MRPLTAVVAASLLLAGAQAALNTDRTLTTSGAVCIDKFNALVRTQYGNDTSCSTLIRSALSTADPTKCPEGTQGSGSAVQKCMAKVAVPWVDFVRNCEVMNVANRAGEAEAATEKKPSCFPDFASVAEFQAWVGGAAASAASPASRASWIAAAAAAAAGALAAAL